MGSVCVCSDAAPSSSTMLKPGVLLYLNSTENVNAGFALFGGILRFRTVIVEPIDMSYIATALHLHCKCLPYISACSRTKVYSTSLNSSIIQSLWREQHGKKSVQSRYLFYVTSFFHPPNTCCFRCEST